MRSIFSNWRWNRRRQYRFFVTGYVVMPEHVHSLVSEPQRGTVAQAMDYHGSSRGHISVQQTDANLGRSQMTHCAIAFRGTGRSRRNKALHRCTG